MRLKSVLFITIFLNGLGLGLSLLWIGEGQGVGFTDSAYQVKPYSSTTDLYQKDFPLFALYGKSYFSMQRYQFVDSREEGEPEKAKRSNATIYSKEYQINPYTWPSVYSFYSIKE